MDAVWVLIIHHDYGVDVYASRTEDGVRAKLYEYVKDWWEQELPDEPMPDNPEEAVETYFENVEDENYFIEQVELID